MYWLYPAVRLHFSGNFCVCVCFSTEDPGLVAKRRAQSHEEVLGGRLAATTSFTINRMGKQQEEKLIGTGHVRLSIMFPVFSVLFL